jgi:hypothetical protein
MLTTYVQHLALLHPADGNAECKLVVGLRCKWIPRWFDGRDGDFGVFVAFTRPLSCEGPQYLKRKLLLLWLFSGGIGGALPKLAGEKRYEPIFVSRELQLRQWSLHVFNALAEMGGGFAGV